MLLTLSVVEASSKNGGEDEDRVIDDEIDIEKVISEITQAVSPYWVTVIEALGGLSLREFFLDES